MRINRRESNFEALRILCMLMIIGGHILISQESMTQIGTFDFYIGNIYRSFAICAVDIFVLISGYFGIHFDARKILSISFETTFYSILIFALSIIAGIHIFTFKKDILLLFPVITQRYWFITIYVLFIIVSPLLNRISDKLNKEQFRFLIMVILVVFYCWPTVCYSVAAPSITKDSGYGIVNFCCLYYIGRYINKHLNKSEYIQNTNYSVLAIISGLFLFGANSLMSAILGFYFQQYIAYDSIFCLFAALSIFMTFKNIKLKSDMINNISKHCFAVYIIHAHPVIWNYLWSKDGGVLNHNLHGLEYVVYLLLLPPLIYFACWIIDATRVKCFGKVESIIINWIYGHRLVRSINKQMQLLEQVGD